GRRRERVLGSAGLLNIISRQAFPAMTTFVAAMMMGAVPAFLAYPNFKVEPAKYRSGLQGVTANLRAKAVVIDAEFSEEMLSSVSIDNGTKLIRTVGKTSPDGLPRP